MRITLATLSQKEVNHYMFKNLTDFRFKRTAAQAVGFYLVYLVLGLAIGGSTSGLFNIIANFFGLTVS